MLLERILSLRPEVEGDCLALFSTTFSFVKVQNQRQRWASRNKVCKFYSLYCSLIEDSVCVEGFLTFYILPELFFKKLKAKNKPLLQIYYQAAATLTLREKVKLYLYCLFLKLAAMTGGWKLLSVFLFFVPVCLCCSLALAPLLSCVCSPWLVFDARRCGTRSQRDPLS